VSQVTLPGSNGRQNEVMVVINHKDWDGKVGLELKKILHANVLGLPQAEPQFTTSALDPQNFKNTLRYNRNILKVVKADSASFIIKHDVNARPQVFVKITGTTQEEIIALIKQNGDKIVAAIKDSDIKDMQRRFAKKSYPIDSLKLFKKHHFALNVPTDYSLVDNQDDFIWFRKRFNHSGQNINGSMNIIAYVLPLEVPFTQIKDSIIAIRDAIGKQYIPGPHEGTYLITEAKYTPDTFETTLAEHKAYKTQGKWEILNEFQAGPFVSYTVEDSQNKRLIVVEGLTYAPSLSKRDFMFEVEAVIRTLKI